MQRVRHSVRENRLTSTTIDEKDYIAALEETGRGWVVEAGGSVVAFAIGNARTGNIWALFVDPAHEARGHGRALHDVMVEWLFSRGVPLLWLSTEPGTRAERFYRAAGWRDAGKLPSGEMRFELTNDEPTQVRLLGPGDAAEFQRLRLAALQDAPAAFASSYEEECDRTIGSIEENLSAKPGRCVIGAFDRGRLVGMTGLAREAPRKLAHRAFLWGVYVAPDARRHGIGRKLIARALEEAAAMSGLRQVNLSVNAANAAAIALYEEAGFESFALERAYLQVDGVLHDEVHMVRHIGVR